MTNIEEMENDRDKYLKSTNPNIYIYVDDFTEHCINSLKDLHEENTRLQSEIAKHSEYIKNLKKEIKELKND